MCGSTRVGQLGKGREWAQRGEQKTSKPVVGTPVIRNAGLPMEEGADSSCDPRGLRRQRHIFVYGEQRV